MNKYVYTLCSFLLLFTLPSSAQFTEVSIESGVAFQHSSAVLIGGGGTFFDYDNDGFLDIYLAGGGNDDGLFHNLRDGSFEDVSDRAGVAVTAPFQTTGVVSGDLDNDGFTDLVVLTWDTQRLLVLHNNGNGTFSEVAEQLGIDSLNSTAFSMGASLGDYNVDGYLDIYVGNYIRDNGGYTVDGGFGHTGYANFFFINNGDGTFQERGDFYGVSDQGCALAVAFTDYDNDADVDIYVANDFGEWVLPNVVYSNLYPSNLFTNLSVSNNLDHEIYAMGIAVGDYNEDGNFDYYISNLGRNRLIQNKGSFQFTDVAIQAGVDNTFGGIDPDTGDSSFATSWGTAFFDYDNDTYVDLFVSNGHIHAIDELNNMKEDPNKLYQNNQADGTFTDVSVDMGVANTDVCRGMAIGDYDNDGDIDMLVIGIADPGREWTWENHAMLYRNDSPSANWLKVRLRGIENNLQGIGSRIEVTVDGRTFIREIDGGTSHASHNSTIAHFGLGDYETIDELKVRWLGGGEDILTNVSINRTITIKEGETTSIEERTAQTLQLMSRPNPFEQNTQIHYTLPNASTVTMGIYDVKGRLVYQTESQNQSAGKHIIEWQADTDLPSGVYFCRLTTDMGIASHRLMLAE